MKQYSSSCKCSDTIVDFYTNKSHFRHFYISTQTYKKVPEEKEMKMKNYCHLKISAKK